MRPVYLRSGDAWSAAGHGLDALRRGCLEQAPAAAEVVFQCMGSEVRLPYMRMQGTPGYETALLAVGRGALERAGLSREQQTAAGLFLGTSSGSIGYHEAAFAEELRRAPEQAICLRLPDPAAAAPILRAALGIEGPNYTIGTACSSAANALLYAAWMIREGHLDEALVVGFEIENRLSQQGFFSLMLATRKHCRPFDAQRDGIVLGECVAGLVLSAEPPATEPIWQLRGGATLCDTTHPTNPSPQQIATTLRAALADAGCEAADIGLIKAHGTGTRSNDQAEGMGLIEVFGAQLPPLTSLKPTFGHTLGACGALELLALTACLDSGRIPPTRGFSETDPELGLTPLTAAQPWSGGLVLANTFGFGGNNCVLVLERSEAPC